MGTFGDMMTHAGRQGSTDHDGTEPAFGRLARRTDLPPRVHKLLDGLFERACAYFDNAVPNVLDEIENALFALAERAQNNAQQQRHFESLREIKRGRADAGPRFLQHVESTLAGIRRAPASAGAVAAQTKDRSRAPLELIEASVLDEDLALREIGTKSEIRHSQALFVLSHRMAVLAATPVWPIDSLPLGPAQLTAAFRHALRNLDLAVEPRVLAYRHFDRMAMLPIAQFYASANAYLLEQRVLPHLQFQANYHRGDAPLPAAAAAEPAAQEASGIAAAQEAPGVAEVVPPMPHTRAIGADAMPVDSSDAVLFNTLRGLLGERRRREGDDYPAARGGSEASHDDLQSMLGSLQRKAPATGSSAPVRHDSEHLKNTLLVKLRRASPQGRPLGLSEEDSDTVDLVGMLFDHIADDLRVNHDTHALLARLHVPVLRVALNDKTFFTRRDHPARELLNTIAETSTRWIDAGDTDTDLVRKMQAVVDHVSADFDGDLGVFEDLLGDLNRHMQTLARRAEVVERRHIDAARGRDKLDMARETAAAEIARILDGSTLNPIARTLLEQAWMDALALSVLRHGAASDEFRRRVQVAEKLARRDAEAAPDEALRQDLDAGLRQVGLHEDDLREVLDHLFAPAAPTPQARNRVDHALAGRTRLGGQPAPAPDDTVGPEPRPLTAAEAEQLAQLRKMPFGTWFEFVTNQQGESAQRKLAWYSTTTGHCLFVNARGTRTDDITLEQLARHMVCDQARVATTEHTSLIDRAWKAILGALRPHGAESAVASPPVQAQTGAQT